MTLGTVEGLSAREVVVIGVRAGARGTGTGGRSREEWLHDDRVYYASERVMRQATTVSRDELVSVGTCFGKFTKSGKFRLKVTCLEHLAEHAKYKVWLKPSAEMSFLYGNHVSKNGIARMTEGVPQYAGVLVLSMSGLTLGFGRAAQTTERCKELDPTAVAVLHQCDVGEYLREEDEVV